jgi:site-specific DNA-adenine methylase
MKSPFPWMGGKSRVADLVWDRFGNVPNYCEPFFGSGAVDILAFIAKRVYLFCSHTFALQFGHGTPKTRQAKHL